MTDWKEVRKHFPALESYTYLNSAAGCALPTQAAEAGKQFYDEMHQLGDIHWPNWLKRVEVVRGQVAAAIGAEPDEIALLSNASIAMNYARSLINPRGSVLLVRGDFPTVTYPWLLSNCDSIFVEPQPDGTIEISDLEDALREDTSCIALGHVQYGSGFRFDLEEVSNFCGSRSLSLVIDSTQSFGAFPIDVGRCSTDVLLFSGYKWSCAGYGIAAMYVRKELLASATIPAAGWMSAEDPDLMDSSNLNLSESAKVLELGHPPFAGIFALGGALTLLSDIGIDKIQERVTDLEQYLRQGLIELDIEVCSPSNIAHRSGIIIAKLSDASRVVRELEERKVFVSLRSGLMRISVHFYNNDDDIEVFLKELKTLM